MSLKTPRSVLIIEARFYEDIADELARGAVEELEAGAWNMSGLPCRARSRSPWPSVSRWPTASWDERDGIAVAWRLAASSAARRPITTSWRGNPRRGLHALAVQHAVPLGNGILTCDSREQAWARASVEGRNKGRDAAPPASS